jgi:fatty acid desaturase
MPVAVVALVLIALALRGLDIAYHHGEVRRLRRLRPPAPHPDISWFRHALRSLRPKPLDSVVAALQFVSVWLLIAAAALVFVNSESLIVRGLCLLFIGGRFRELQEIGHFAIHGVLCPSRQVGLLLTNIFCQFPLFKPSAYFRYRTHVVEHHPHANLDGQDPNLVDFTVAGLVPGITALQYWRGVLFPLTPAGIRLLLKEGLTNLLHRNHGTGELVLRALIVALITLATAMLGSAWGIVWIYLVPLVIIYPLFSWLSQVAEHRWFLPLPSDLSRLGRELAFGRPTDYAGLSGLLIRHNIFPFGDSYHLAHSLFPHVRWNYLPAVHELLKRHLEGYMDHASQGLFWHPAGIASATSELRERLTRSPLALRITAPDLPPGGAPHRRSSA